MTYQNIANKIKLLINSLYGNLLILPYAILGTQGIKKLEPSKKEPQIVISLTSYGKRVTRTVFYTIISMLKQNKRLNPAFRASRSTNSAMSVPTLCPW